MYVMRDERKVAGDYDTVDHRTSGVQGRRKEDLPTNRDLDTGVSYTTLQAEMQRY